MAALEELVLMVRRGSVDLMLFQECGCTVRTADLQDADMSFSVPCC